MSEFSAISELKKSFFEPFRKLAIPINEWDFVFEDRFDFRGCSLSNEALRRTIDEMVKERYLLELDSISLTASSPKNWGSFFAKNVIAKHMRLNSIDCLTQSRVEGYFLCFLKKYKKIRDEIISHRQEVDSCERQELRNRIRVMEPEKFGKYSFDQ